VKTLQERADKSALLAASREVLVVAEFCTMLIGMQFARFFMMVTCVQVMTVINMSVLGDQFVVA
jgi:hypothetical protein